MSNYADINVKQLIRYFTNLDNQDAEYISLSKVMFYVGLAKIKPNEEAPRDETV